MYSFRGRVKDLLIGFSQRLQLAYEREIAGKWLIRSIVGLMLWIWLRLPMPIIPVSNPDPCLAVLPPSPSPTSPSSPVSNESSNPPPPLPLPPPPSLVASSSFDFDFDCVSSTNFFRSSKSLEMSVSLALRRSSACDPWSLFSSLSSSSSASEGTREGDERWSSDLEPPSRLSWLRVWFTSRRWFSKICKL